MIKQTKKFYFFFVASILMSALGCEKETSEVSTTPIEGYLSLDVVVNPLIHTYANSYFLSIDEVRIEGHERESLFSRYELTIDASVAPTSHYLYSSAALTPGGYSHLALDFNTTAAVGCNIANMFGQKDFLGLGTDDVYTVQVDGTYLIEDGVTTNRVLLLDLNELISPFSGEQVDFSFLQKTTKNERSRLYDPEKIGHIKGRIVRTTTAPIQTYRLVAYAYRLGSFDAEVEVRNGFSTTYLSTNVGRNDQFVFPVLPEGLFEIVIAHYVDEDQDGVLEFKELLQADAGIRADTRMARVSAKTETSIEVNLGGVIVD